MGDGSIRKGVAPNKRAYAVVRPHILTGTPSARKTARADQTSPPGGQGAPRGRLGPRSRRRRTHRTPRPRLRRIHRPRVHQTRRPRTPLTRRHPVHRSVHRRPRWIRRPRRPARPQSSTIHHDPLRPRMGGRRDAVLSATRAREFRVMLSPGTRAAFHPFARCNFLRDVSDWDSASTKRKGVAGKSFNKGKGTLQFRARPHCWIGAVVEGFERCSASARRHNGCNHGERAKSRRGVDPHANIHSIRQATNHAHQEIVVIKAPGPSLRGAGSCWISEALHRLRFGTSHYSLPDPVRIPNSLRFSG